MNTHDFAMMTRVKEYFEMSRHERRGAIMVLILIALLLVATFAVRSCRQSASPVQDEALIRQFETEADTTTLMAPHKKSFPKPSPNTPRKSHPKKKRHPVGPKRPPAPRLDPVPQF